MKLISFGEIIWDIYENDRTLGGAPLNFAAHAALQGCESYLASAVGNDGLGQAATAQIRAMGLCNRYISTVQNRPTGQCRITLNEKGVPTYTILEDTAYDRITVDAEKVKGFDALAFGTLALRNEYNRQQIKALLTSVKFSEIYTDLNIRPPFYSGESINLCLSAATIVKISDEEMPLITDLLYGKKTAVEDAARLIYEHFPNIRLLLVTKGAEGAVCYDCKNQKFYSCPAEPADVVSSVGAGDSFGATFLYQYIKTGDILHSMALASKVSAFVVSRKGAIPSDMKEFLEKF